MRLAYVLLVGLVVGCADENPVRHIPDAPFAPDAAIDAPGDVELKVTIAGNGDGKVMSNPDGIDCSGASCTALFMHSTDVELTAMPSMSSVFTGWSGACYGDQPTCRVSLAQAKDVTATFTLKKYSVSVVRGGAGMGTVSGGGLACGTTCQITVDHGTELSLAAAPASLSVFAGWG